MQSLSPKSLAIMSSSLDDLTATPNDATPERKQPRNSKRIGEFSATAFLHKAIGLASG
jgi:hypothetical protein